MKWLAIVSTVGILVFAITIILPPFVPPSPLYAVLYGWRYPKSWECGTSVVTDFGPREARHRFVVDAGTIDLSTEGISSFSCCEMPEEVSYIALAVSWDERPIHIGGPVGWRNHDKVSDTQVSIRVSDSSGNMVASHFGRLGQDWTWSGPNGHLRNEVWLYGSGTEFHPVAGESYSVEVLVDNPSLDKPIVRLVAAGGGWK